MEIEELEEILKKYKLNKPKTLVKEAEEQSLPFMLTTFRSLIFEGIPPTQNAFILEFKNNHPDLKIRGIVSRLKRAYMSYIREYHLGFLLEKYFDDVTYDEEIDISGVDYVIKYKGIYFNIHAFVNTKNSRYWRRRKNKRHKFTGEHIDVPMNLSKGKKVGKFFLYTENDITKLRRKMDKVATEPNEANVESTSSPL